MRLIRSILSPVRTSLASHERVRFVMTGGTVVKAWPGAAPAGTGQAAGSR